MVVDVINKILSVSSYMLLPQMMKLLIIWRLFESGSLKNRDLYDNLHKRLIILGKKLNAFIQSVEKEHQSNK